MQDEQREETNAKMDKGNARERFMLINSVMRDAFTSLGIKDISEYKGEPLNRNRQAVGAMSH